MRSSHICSKRQTQDKVLKKVQLSFAKQVCAETLVSEGLRAGNNLIDTEKNSGSQFKYRQYLYPSALFKGNLC